MRQHSCSSECSTDKETHDRRRAWGRRASARVPQGWQRRSARERERRSSSLRGARKRQRGGVRRKVAAGTNRQSPCHRWGTSRCRCRPSQGSSSPADWEDSRFSRGLRACTVARSALKTTYVVVLAHLAVEARRDLGTDADRVADLEFGDLGSDRCHFAGDP